MLTTFRALIGGKSGIRKISASDWECKGDTKGSEVDVAGLVMGFDAGSYVPKKGLKRIHRSAQFSIVAACASGAIALTDACRIISRGEADVMAAGASEAAVHRVALHSFNKIHALNNQIRVNAVACGLVNTGMASKLTEEQRERIISLSPLGRLIEVEEAANPKGENS